MSYSSLFPKGNEWFSKCMVYFSRTSVGLTKSVIMASLQISLFLLHIQFEPFQNLALGFNDHVKKVRFRLQ